MSRRIATTSQIFRIPLLIAVVSGIGLASALLGDGVWDVLSWLSLSVPIGLVVFHWTRRTL